MRYCVRPELVGDLGSLKDDNGTVFPFGVEPVMGGVPSGTVEKRNESSSRLKSLKSSSRAEDDPVGESKSSSPRVRGEVCGVSSKLRIGFVEAFDEGEDERLRE